MKSDGVPAQLRQQLSDYIARRTGLHFPTTRWLDLERGLTSALKELGFQDLAAGAAWLLSTPLTKSELNVVASHLTIGETYFFREQKTFEVLRENVLPQLINAQRTRDRRLRIWSAACCSGEEAFSLAILIREMIPDIANWHVTILATDINVRFLKKATAGLYRDWSFRDTPAWVKHRYFNRTPDGSYSINPEIKNLVTFVQLNLVEDVFPSLTVETNAMDLILCRNVLMYFAPEQATKVVTNLHRSLVSDGWLAVSPSETSQALFNKFVTVNFPGSTLYRKGSKPSTIDNTHAPAPPPSYYNADSQLPVPERFAFSPSSASPAVTTKRKTEPIDVCDVASGCYEKGEYEKVVELLGDATDVVPDSRRFSLLTRALADQGRLTDALQWCDQWVTEDKLNSAGHYLRAIVLQELGNIDQARRSFQTALYLQPEFVLAHFSLGNLDRSQGRRAHATRQFANALRLLGNCRKDDVLPESDGLTAGRLSEIISSINETDGIR